MCDYLCFVWVRSGRAPLVRALLVAALRILSRSFLVPKFLAFELHCVSTYSVPPPRVVASGRKMAARPGMADPTTTMSKAPLSIVI